MVKTNDTMKMKNQMKNGAHSSSIYVCDAVYQRLKLLPSFRIISSAFG